MSSITITALADSVNNTRFLWDDEQAKVDMLARPTPLLDNLRAKSKKAHNGGELIIEPHEFYTHSTPTRFTGAGFDVIDYTFTTIGYPARYEWADFVQPIGYSGHEKRLNSGEAQIIDIIKQRTMNVKRHHDRMKQRSMLIQDVGAMTDIIPINGDDYSDGAIEAATAGSGSQNNTYLNISKSTFASRPGWQNQYQTLSGAFSTNFHKLRVLHNQAKRLGNSQGTRGAPQWVYYWSPDCYDNYDKFAITYKRFVNPSGNTDIVAGEQEMFSSVPIVQMPTDMPTTGPWSALLLDHACIRYHVNQGLDTTQGDWHPMAAAQQDAMVSLVHSMVQLSFGYLGTSGIAINGDAY